MTKLKCRVCAKYSEWIKGRKNFSNKWISGADLVRMTNVLNHAKSDQHVHAINLLKKELAQAQGVSIAAYAPTVWSFNSILEDAHWKLQTKFDIAFLLHQSSLPNESFK